MGTVLLLGLASTQAAADPAAPNARHSLALIAVTSGEGVSDKQARTIEETLLAALDSTRRFKVVGRSDIDALLTLEAKKEATGCADTGCMIQIAGALGVDLVSTADVGRLGKNMLITLKVIEVHTATVVARAQVKSVSDDTLPDAARELADTIVRDLESSPTAPAVTALSVAPTVPPPSATTPPSMPTATPPALNLTPPAQPAAVDAVRIPAAKGANPTFVATWVMLGVGAAAAIVASVAGATGQQCPQHPETPLGVSSAYACESTYSTAANVGWAIAGASALTAGVLVFTWVGKGDAADGGRIGVAVAPTGAALGGTF